MAEFYVLEEVSDRGFGILVLVSGIFVLPVLIVTEVNVQ